MSHYTEQFREMKATKHGGVLVSCGSQQLADTDALWHPQKDNSGNLIS